MQKGFSINIYGLIFSIMLVVAALTYILPAGQYNTVQKDGRTYTVAGSYHRVDPAPQGIGAVLTAPAKRLGIVPILSSLFLLPGLFLPLLSAPAR